MEQTFRVFRAGVIVQRGKQRSTGVGGEEVHSLLRRLGFLQRGEQAEGRIDGGVVEEEAVAEIDHADVGCALPDAAADAEENETADQQPHTGKDEAVAHRLQTTVHSPEQQTRGKKNCDRNGEHDATEIPARHALQRTGGAVEIAPRRAVKFRSPETIEAGISHHDAAKDEGNEEGIYLIYIAHVCFRQPDGDAEQQPEWGRGVAGSGEVQRESVPHHLQQVCRADAFPDARRLSPHETRLRHDEEQGRGEVEKGENGQWRTRSWCRGLLPSFCRSGENVFEGSVPTHGGSKLMGRSLENCAGQSCCMSLRRL